MGLSSAAESVRLSVRDVPFGAAGGVCLRMRARINLNNSQLGRDQSDWLI